MAEHAPIEHRIFPSAELHIEQRAGKPPVIAGYAAVFNSLSVPLWGFREKIKPGAFGENLKTDPDVMALFNHDPNLILGRTKSKTLRLWEDDHGLKIENEPPASPTGENVVEAIRRGDIDRMSFAFRVPKGGDDWDWSEDGDEDIRTLLKVELFDVSPVTYPAYPETSVGLRAFPDAAMTRLQRRIRQGLPLSPGDRDLLEEMAARTGIETRPYAKQHEQVRLLLDLARAQG